jgi:hypothetical protein
MKIGQMKTRVKTFEKTLHKRVQGDSARPGRK